MAGSALDEPDYIIEQIGGVFYPKDRYFAAPAVAAPEAAGLRASGTRKLVWQNWHLTSLPRTSSGTDSILRQRRLGQIN